MIDEQFRLEVLDWIANDTDPDTASLLSKWLTENNETELRKSFNGFLEFGTAGLRGPVRPGPSGMNRAVVGRTAAGIAAFLISKGLSKVVIGRDARHGSKEFMQESAEILSGAGLEVYLLPRELPTPVLAFAVNELKMDCGIMVTASHNPAIDNGYKVYLGGTVDGVDYRGSQIVAPIDKAISRLINEVVLPSQRGSGWNIVGEEVVTSYVSKCVAGATEAANQKIVYTAMHGVGAKTLLSVFEAANFTKPILVEEQCAPDPDFPTVAFPNPEEPGAMDLAIKLAISQNADLVIANDPDADRCAVAAKDSVGNWRTLRGDELGILLGHYISKSEITCPGPEAALALVGAARRLGIVAKAREVRGVDRVVIRDGDAIGVLLTRLGAHESVLAWEERRMRREVRATANRLANFDDANLRRSARAAVAASARVARAMEILGPEIPDHLKEAGELRIQHGQASLEELGSLAVPPMTKDAIAGRIRRLLAMADKRASDLGIPDTEAGLSPDLLN